MVCDNCKAVCLSEVRMYRAKCPECGTIIDVCIDCFHEETGSLYCPDCLTYVNPTLFNESK